MMLSVVQSNQKGTALINQFIEENPPVSVNTIEIINKLTQSDPKYAAATDK